ncbi:hypothetical protein G6F32_014535 [Rhizopus arrhizus]|nr:hypothetical protein G6F32_014535 [Rhizopus arrhizus]
MSGTVHRGMRAFSCSQVVRPRTTTIASSHNRLRTALPYIARNGTVPVMRRGDGPAMLRGAWGEGTRPPGASISATTPGRRWQATTLKAPGDMPQRCAIMASVCAPSARSSSLATMGSRIAAGCRQE